MEDVKRWLQASVDPFGAFPALAARPRAWVALLLVVAMQLSVPLVASVRLDARRSTWAELETESKSDFAEMTDRELEEKVERRTKQHLAVLAANATVLTAVDLFFWALLLRLSVWFVAGTTTFAACWSLALHAATPLWVRSLAMALVMWSLPAVQPSELMGLLPAHLSFPSMQGAWKQALEGLDLFLVWRAVLFGAALHVAAGVRVRRVLAFTGVGLATWVALTRVALPRLAGG